MPTHLLLLVSFVFCFSNVLGQNLNYSTIDNSLIDEIEQSGKTNFDIYIILEDKLDVEELDRQLTSSRVSPEVRAKTVLTALQSKARDSQAQLIGDMLSSKNVIAQSINSYWIANVIFLTANKEAIAEFSNDSRVEFIGLDGELKLEESLNEGPAPVEPDGVESGLEAINVRPMWEMGYTGYGQLALVCDTGIDPTHRAFTNRYRGNTNGDNEAWYVFGDQNASPFQCGDHGTHVLGTLLGLDASTRDTIGVAYDAQWMGAAVLCAGRTQSNVGSFQWSLNPDGNLDTTDDMADVINNSWWDPSVFGEDCNSIYRDVLIALETAGVAVVFSAGNAGPDPSTITSPKNINIDLVNTFSVAALNANSNTLPIAEFSSNGPSTCGGEGALLIKPEVAAPGQSVRSAILDNEYGFKSGTSMAAPHVAGSILVLKQAFPNATSRELKMALYRSCRDLGEPGEDNTFGAGIIDVFAAYQYMIDEGFIAVPSIPSAHDVMALNFDTDPIECDATLSGEFRFLNNNSDTLRSLDIAVFVDGILDEELSMQWEGIIEPLEIGSVLLNRSSFSDGLHNIEIVISNPNGMIDERTLNNSTSKEILISERMQLANIEVENQSTCNESSTLVKTNFEGEGVVRWFDNIENGNQIGEGTQFVLPVPDREATIYADLIRFGRSGKEQVDPAGLVLSNGLGEGISFNVNTPLRIVAFDFYSEQSGNVFIGVESGINDNISQLDSELIRSDGTGWQTAEVSIKLSPGVNYRMLYKDGGIQFGSANVDIDFPYSDEEGNLMVIGNESGEQNSYKFFFNLQTEYSDFCGRVPVQVNSVLSSDEAPIAIFEPNISLVDIDDIQAISFTNNSLNGESYLWDFGDGNTSTEKEPSHTYTEAGVYYASLLVKGENGCDDATVVKINVISNAEITSVRDVVGVHLFSLAPNPVSSQLNFVSESPIEVSEIKLYNSMGQLIGSYAINGQISSHSLDMNKMTSGLYYFVIKTESGMETHKVIKL